MQSSSLASASLPNHQRLLYFISQYSVITHVVQLPNKINVSFLNVIKGEQPLLIPQLLLKYYCQLSWFGTELSCMRSNREISLGYFAITSLCSLYAFLAHRNLTSSVKEVYWCSSCLYSCSLTKDWAFLACTKFIISSGRWKWVFVSSKPCLYFTYQIKTRSHRYHSTVIRIPVLIRRDILHISSIFQYKLFFLEVP